MKRSGSNRWFKTAASALLIGVMLAGCRETSSSSPSAPSPSGSSSPSSSSNQVAITGFGLNPFRLEISVGNHVTFVNKDVFPHHFASGCGEIDQVGLLQPGQSRNTGNFAGAVTCSYSDRLNPAQPLLKGTIVAR